MEKNYLTLKKTIAFAILGLVFGLTNIEAQVTTQTYSYTGSMQSWTVPPLCVNSITIEAKGAQGGDNQSLNGLGGKGAFMIGTFTAGPGQVFKIIVAGKGSNNTGGNANNGAGGGGGGSFVYVQGASQPLIVAGGGGGSSLVNNGVPNYYGMDASITTNGTGSRSHVLFNDSPGGIGGADGTTVCGSGGKGWNSVLTNPAGNPAGNPTYGAAGGYGGGGGAGTAPGGCNYLHTAGGGGGYSGGGAGGTCYYHGGGGGGSFNAGTNQVNTASVQTGDGLVVIKYSQGTPITTTVAPFAICSGSTANLSAGGMLSYTWSTGSNATNINVTPLITTNYTVQGTNVQNCITTAIITVTVSSGLPVLSVSSSTNLTCLGKTVTLTATGALTYTWSAGVTNGLTYSPTITQAYTVTGENGCGTTTAVTTITVAPLPISVITTPTLICASNPATMTAVGAATLFTWTPFPALLTGTTIVVNPSVTTLYTVTASDGTCAGTATVLLTVDPIPTISIVANASLVCEGYPVNMTASGGLSYTWMPGNLSGPSVTVNPTAPTLYTVVGSNSFGCVAGAPQILLTNPSPTITISANNTFVCAGAAVNITAGGGNTYTWSNGPTIPGIAVNPTVTTSYTVIGTAQNGTCTGTQTIAIVVFNPAFTITGPSTICSGSSATLVASGADSYLWDNGANVNLIVVSPTLSTIYTVGATTTSNNITCTATNTIQVSVSPKPIVTAASSRTLICKSESSILTAGGAISYTWNTSSTSATITVTPTVPVLYTYTVTGTNANGCTNIATTQVKVNSCNGISETAMRGAQLLVYPNPNKGEFVIESDSEITLTMVNELGQLVKTINLSGSNNFKASVSDLANGIYFVTGQKNGQKINQKIIVNK